MKISISGSTIVSGVHVGAAPVVQASGPDVTRTHALSAVTSVKLTVPAEMVCVIGDGPEQLTVHAPAEVQRMLDVRVVNSELVVQLLGSVALQGPIRMVARLARLRAVTLEGAGTLLVEGVKGDAFFVNVSGSGEVSVEGEVSLAEVRLNGSGEADLSRLSASDVRVALAGSGDARVHATHAVSVSLAGSGAVTVTGNPGERAVSERGSGRVRFR